MDKTEYISGLSAYLEGEWPFNPLLDYVHEILKIMIGEDSGTDSAETSNKILIYDLAYNFGESILNVELYDDLISKTVFDAINEEDYEHDSVLKEHFTNHGLDSDKMWYVYCFLKDYCMRMLSAKQRANTIEECFVKSIDYLLSEDSKIKISSPKSGKSIVLSDKFVKEQFRKALVSYMSTHGFNQSGPLAFSHSDPMTMEEVKVYCAYLVMELIARFGNKTCSKNETYATVARFLWCTRLYVSDSFEKNGMSLKAKLSKYNPPKRAILP